jgi:hypothetical protein
MEPTFSVLLYSKYSEKSKKLMNIIQNSGIDFLSIVALQPVCIDNEQIRNRIVQSQKINITSVPCILVIFPDGGIEKYDGSNAFDWVTQIIQRHTPKQIHKPQPQIQSSNSDEREKRLYEQEKLLEQKIKEIEQEKIREQNKKKFEEHEEPKPINDKHIRRRSQQKMTAIDDLPDEDEEESRSDRYRYPKPIGRIREDSGNYIQNDELFQGDPPDMRKERKNAVKSTDTGRVETKPSDIKSTDLMIKAKELAKGRENDAPPIPPGHPANNATRII